MVCTFQDEDYLYMVLDFMPGGDLRHYISHHKILSEAETSNSHLILEFIIACTVLGLEYMHKRGVLHRDVKPENLVIDEEGYVRLTDLGIARLSGKDNSRDNSGTPGYSAPEVLCKQEHGVGVDYFALGVLAYEAMKGVVRKRTKCRDHIKGRMRRRLRARCCGVRCS
eukprot:TRINITY_DN3673_c0_g2_i2.p1 TRINITY_DN3673_c0_g2~~TRINITY_DN3673_c0_g2_i2.p1  ORF type:complete len:168 (+),score=29.56 TRINITY_DN3673_c0_g2_i2:379-882(+)